MQFVGGTGKVAKTGCGFKAGKQSEGWDTHKKLIELVEIQVFGEFNIEKQASIQLRSNTTAPK